MLVAVLFTGAATGDTDTDGRHATWQLIDYQQKGCIGLNETELSTLYGVYIQGSWTHSITAGLENAPDGATIGGYYLPVPPGSSNGEGSVAYVTIEIPPDTPTGHYMMKLWPTTARRGKACR